MFVSKTAQCISSCGENKCHDIQFVVCLYDINNTSVSQLFFFFLPNYVSDYIATELVQTRVLRTWTEYSIQCIILSEELENRIDDP